MKEHIGRREYSVEVKKYGPKEITVKKSNKLKDTPEVIKELPLEPNNEISETLPAKERSVVENACTPTQNFTKNTTPVGGKMIPEILFQWQNKSIDINYTTAIVSNLFYIFLFILKVNRSY